MFAKLAKPSINFAAAAAASWMDFLLNKANTWKTILFAILERKTEISFKMKILKLNFVS
jgi:hypothetical protein